MSKVSKFLGQENVLNHGHSGRPNFRLVLDTLANFVKAKCGKFQVLGLDDLYMYGVKGHPYNVYNNLYNRTLASKIVVALSWMA